MSVVTKGQRRRRASNWNPSGTGRKSAFRTTRRVGAFYLFDQLTFEANAFGEVDRWGFSEMKESGPRSSRIHRGIRWIIPSLELAFEKND